MKDKKSKKELDLSEYLTMAKEIREWMEINERENVPNSNSEDKEECEMAKKLRLIRKKVIKPYSEIEKMNERRMYELHNPEILEIEEVMNEIFCGNGIKRHYLEGYLVRARELKKWIEEGTDDKLPSARSDDEVESKLGRVLQNIRIKIVEPYNNMTEKQKKDYIAKRPELQEILDIMNWVNEKRIPLKLKQVREIKEWTKNNNTYFKPRMDSEDQEERRLARVLSNIRNNEVRPYLLMEDNKKEKYRKTHPEIKGLLEICYDIYINGRTENQLLFAGEIKEELKALEEKDANIDEER